MPILLLLIAMVALQAQTPAQVEKSNRAKVLLAENKFAEAAVLYTELVQAIPNNPGLLLNQGMALHLSGADQKAIAPLEAALKLNPNIPPALLFLGASYLRSGQPAKALAPLEKFIAADPNHVEARQMIIDAAHSSGQPQRALPHLEKLAQLDGNQAGVWYELGRSYQAAEASTFTQIEKQFPESGPFFALLGDTRSRASQRRAAFFFYRKALEKSPTLPGIHTSIAEIYRLSDHPEWALHEEAVAARMPKPNCAVKNAECEYLAGRFPSAIRMSRSLESATNLYWRARSYHALAAEAFRKLEGLPASPELYRYQAEAFRDQNLYAESAVAWQKALDLMPGHPDFTRELAATQLKLKNYEEAQKLCSALLAKEPNAPDLNLLQGDIYLSQQQPEKSEPFLRRAVKADSGYLEAQASLARALLALGRAKDALPHVTAALPLDADGSLHIQLARAYQSAGLAAEARAAMAKYQQIQTKIKAQDKVLEEELKILPPQ